MRRYDNVLHVHLGPAAAKLNVPEERLRDSLLALKVLRPLYSVLLLLLFLRPLLSLHHPLLLFLLRQLLLHHLLIVFLAACSEGIPSSPSYQFTALYVSPSTRCRSVLRRTHCLTVLAASQLAQIADCRHAP